MITPDTDQIFPNCPTFGFSAQPDVLVKIIEREGGFERRDRKWDEALRRYEGMPLGNRPEADIEALMYFWLAIGGTASVFRFKDWADFKSCRLGQVPSPVDQPLEFIGGSPGGYRTLKQYVYGPLVQTRVIYKPKGDTVRVANELGQEQNGSLWTVEEATGFIVPEPGFVGTPTSWGGEFYVRARFDGPFRMELVNYKIQSLTCTVIERRPEST